MCGRKDCYTDEEFWEQNPYPDHPDNDAYDIGDTPSLLTICPLNKDSKTSLCVIYFTPYLFNRLQRLQKSFVFLIVRCYFNNA